MGIKKDCVMREMVDGDLSLVLEWRNAPDVRKNMYTSHEITLDEHRVWFESVKNDGRKKYFVFEVN